jgi:glycerate dehydrogenase
MPAQKIVFLDRNAIRVPLRSPSFEHEWVEYPFSPPGEVAARLASATIAATNRAAITADLLEKVPSLRLIAVAATGYDQVDIEACKAFGVSVCNVRDWSISVPEHVFALTLALRRQLFNYRAAIKAGRWQQSPTYCVLLDPMPIALAGSTMGLVGYGTLSQRVETIAQAFGMKILVAERKGAAIIRAGRTPFEEVLARSDVLTVLCPLSEETRNLIGEKELALMQRHSLLINCARGGIVDETALAQALQTSVIGGAATDVLVQEPPVNGNPLLDLQLSNLIVTPHVAWASVQSLEHIAEQLIGNMEAFVGGTPQNLVT